MKQLVRIVIATAGVFIIGAQVFGEVPIPPNRSVTGMLEGIQNEEQVWICPYDTNIIITNHRDFRLGYRQIGLGRSTTNGLFWTDTLISFDFQVFSRQSDPVMTVNSAGDIIISHLDYNPGEYTGDSRVAFLVSNDCGESWQGPYVVTDNPGPVFEDKQFITSDRTGGPYDGSVYVSWTRFPNPTRIEFARSTNNAVSFEDTLIVGPVITSSCWSGASGAGQFSQPLVGKDGAVYVFWQGYIVDSVPDCGWCPGIRFTKSTDGGVSWQGDRALICVDGYNWVDGGIDVYSQLTTDADITDGPHGGNLYLQWRDLKSEWPWDSDIMFMRSLDTGHTWSEPVRVNDDPPGVDVDQFHNWIICNDQGILVSIWYDQRVDPFHYMFDVFAAYSYDGGATWTSNHRVSSVSSTPDWLARQMDETVWEDEITGTTSPMEPLSPMAGKIAEYIGVSSIGDIVAAVWTDTRDGYGAGGQDVYSARWHLPLTDPRLIFPLNGEEVDETPGLLWAAAWKETEDGYCLQIDDDQNFGSPDLDVFATGNLYDDPLTGLSGGLYYWRIKAYKAPGGTPTDSTEFSEPGSFLLNTCDCGTWGDVTGDGQINPQDVTYMVQYVYFDNDMRVPYANCPYEVGDVDCNGGVPKPPDVTYYVQYVYFDNDMFCPDPCGP